MIYMHHGYHFRYFLTENTGDDPPVFGYVEGEENPVEKWDSISSYFDKFSESVYKHFRFR